MLYQQIASNKRKTLVVIVLYMALFIAVGIGIGYYAIRNAAAGVIIAPCCRRLVFNDDDCKCD